MASESTQTVGEIGEMDPGLELQILLDDIESKHRQLLDEKTRLEIEFQQTQSEEMENKMHAINGQLYALEKQIEATINQQRMLSHHDESWQNDDLSTSQQNCNIDMQPSFSHHIQHAGRKPTYHTRRFPRRQCLCRKLGKIEPTKSANKSTRRSSQQRRPISGEHNCSCRMKCTSLETCTLCSVFHSTLELSKETENTSLYDHNSSKVYTHQTHSIPGNSMGVFENCASNEAAKPCDSVDICKSCENAYGPTSKATIYGDTSCDSMGVCSICARNEAAKPCDSVDVCKSCANAYRPTSKATVFGDTSCDSMGVCSICARNEAAKPCDSVDVCKSCANAYRPTSKATVFGDTSCDSMGVCSNCARNEAAKPCDSVDVCKSCANAYRPTSKATVFGDTSCDSMGFCSNCARNEAAKPCDSVDVCKSCANAYRPTSKATVFGDTSCDSMGVCSNCARNLAAKPCDSVDVCKSCANAYRPTSKATVFGDTSCDSMRACSNCARNKAAKPCDSVDVCKSCANAYTPTSQEPVSVSCDSMDICEFCADQTHFPKKLHESFDKDDSSEFSPKAQDNLPYSTQNQSSGPKVSRSKSGRSDANLSQHRKSKQAFDKITDFELLGQKEQSSKFDINENIVIRAAYVTIQPYTRPISQRRNLVTSKREIGQNDDYELTSASLKKDYKTKHQKSFKNVRSAFSSDDGTGIVESESNQSMRSSADFFKASKQQASSGKKSVTKGVLKSANVTKATSSVLIRSSDDLRRRSQSMTSLARLLQKTPNKMQSVTAEINQKNKEYKQLHEAFQKSSDRLEKKEIQHRMDACKSNIRSSVKIAMFEQRKNKTEKFNPIPIALFDEFDLN